MLGVVFADVVQVEALGRRVVELDRAQLPGAAERVGDVEVDLRTVERAVALVERVGHARRFERAPERRLGAIPHRIVADALFGTRRELDGSP